jgi:hypothetical protein
MAPLWHPTQACQVTVAEIETRSQGRRLWGGIVIAWLATSVGSVVLGGVGFMLQNAAWALAECLGSPCAPKGPRPGPEILVVALAIAVIAFAIALLVAFVPTRRVYGISLGASALLLTVLTVAHAQGDLLLWLPDLPLALATSPFETVTFVLAEVPDLLLVVAIVVASAMARRRSLRTG